MLVRFIVENLARGRKKHAWVSFGITLYKDIQRDLQDPGLGTHVAQKCYNLGKFKLQESIVVDKGVIFTA